LGKNGLEALTHYPSTQAALAQTVNLGDEAAAERFEIYYQGVELCNGYHELANAKEQRLRLEEANACRVKLGKDSLPVDEQFLSALEKGLPNTCGVAVGFDRLIMLRHHTTLSHVLTFDWTTS
jgi:lysyl-tRNA synthetase class 2